MRNPVRTPGKVVLVVFALVGLALAQNFQTPAPHPAASGPNYDLSVGYSYLTMRIPEAGRVPLNGVNLGGRIELSPRWGVGIDSNYAHASDVLGTPHGAYALTFLGGPVFSLVDQRSTRVFVHALAGVGVVDAAVPQSPTEYLHGWVTRPSYALGGGVEHSIAGPVGIRVSGDYLRTSFFNHLDVVQPQNDLRLTVGLVLSSHRRGY